MGGTLPEEPPEPRESGMRTNRGTNVKASTNIHGTLFSVFFSILSLLRGEYSHSLAYFITAIAWAISAAQVQEQAKLSSLVQLVIGGGVVGIVWAGVVAQYKLMGLIVGNLNPLEVFWYAVWHFIAGIMQPIISLTLYPVPSVLEFVGRRGIRANAWIHIIIVFYSFLISYSTFTLLLYWFAR